MLTILVASFLLLTVAAATGDNAVVWLDTGVQQMDFQRRRSLLSLANVIELVGQRGVVYPTALVLTAWLARAIRQWRPLVLLAASLLAVNVIVGATKLLTGRQGPSSGEVAFFNGGEMFPSGHAANVVLVWGLVAYLLVRYGRWQPRRGVLPAAVTAAALALGAASVYLNTHWVSDLLAGWLAGAMILQAATLLDRHDPRDLLRAARARLAQLDSRRQQRRESSGIVER